MGGGYTFLLFIWITLFFVINAQAIPTPRQTFEIIIGGGGQPPSLPPENQNCPPPPPPPCPPPPPPPCPPPPPPPCPPPPPSPKPSPPPPPPSPKPSPPPPPPSPKPKPPSPKPKPPPPPDGFENELLRESFKVIQAFKKKVTMDPKHITDTWNGSNICGDYRGFRCDILPKTNKRTVSGVKFNNYNFGGPDLTVAELLFGLKDIAFFHANSNNFTGSIPTNISKLRFLYELDLSNNKFTGGFPYEVLGAKQLVFLDLRFNTFAGTVPPQVFRLDLDLLFINNNRFLQNLPDNLGSTPVLYLSLANNGFTGGIPPSIGQTSDTLLEVLFLNNRLTGCLPYEIGFLHKSTVFDVGTNSLTGPIPLSFQCLEKMELLNMANNKFYGEVPEAVCSLPHLSNFTLSYNYFTQVGPVCRKLIHSGVLNVKMNCILDLHDQRSAMECAKFFSTLHVCPNPKSLTTVPCPRRYTDSRTELESSEIRSTAPAPAPAPRWKSYESLAPH